MRMSQAGTLALIGAALICVSCASSQSTAKATGQMNKMDVNKDKQISKEEYMKYQEQRFDAADKDKSKGLSEQEWMRHQLDESDGG